VPGGLACLARFAFAGDHDGPHGQVVRVILDAFLAVAAVCGDGPWTAPGADDALDSRGELRSVSRIALLHGVVHDDTVVLAGDLGLVAELDGLAEAALCDRPGVRVLQLTGRLAPAGVIPASRCRVWAAIRRVTSSRLARSLTARCSRPRRQPAAASRTPAAASSAALAFAQRSAPRALASSRSASAAARSASPASSPVIRRTVACASSRPSAPRSPSLAAIPCARAPAGRLRSRTRVRVAPPAAWIRRPVAAIRRIAFASSPESVGKRHSPAPP